MSKFIYGLIVGIVLALLVSLSHSANAETLGNMQKQTVAVSTPSGDGSGVVIGPNTVLTAKHVVLNDGGKLETSIIISLPGGDAKANSNVQLIENTDLAIIHVAAIGIKPANISCTEAKQADRVTALGFPLGLMLMYSEGYIAGIRIDAGYYWAYLPLNHGNSGGPVYDKDDNVIAVVSGGITDEKKEGSMISRLAALSPFCDEIKKGIY